MSKSIEKPGFWAVIPASVRYDTGLSASEKLLYAEISSLCHSSGECWAKSSYFAELYCVSRETVSRWVSSLQEKNHISVVVKDGNNRVIKMSVGGGWCDEKITGGVMKRSQGCDEKITPPYIENNKENTDTPTPSESEPSSAPKSRSKKKGARVPANSDLMVAVGNLKGRKADTLWTVSEAEALKAACITADELAVVSEYYLASDADVVKLFGANIRRRTIDTLLNNWPKEVDRANEFVLAKRSQQQKKLEPVQLDLLGDSIR